MSTSSLPEAAPMAEGTKTPHAKISRVLRIMMEAVLLVMIFLSPWPYGAVHPGFEAILWAGIALLVVLWAGRMLVDCALSWQKCPVALCLIGWFFLGIWQIMPLGNTVLTVLSPATARLYEQLRPAQPEQLALGEQPVTPSPPAGTTISLYPQVTQVRLLQLLAYLLVFVVVRNNLATPDAFRRLAAAGVINGTLLAIFAIAQRFSSPSDTLYWTYRSVGNVFGPFICRNHFPYYVNMCIGLGLGLLWSISSQSRGQRKEQGQNGLDWTRELLGDARSLWLCAALALMLSSIAVSLSRGGFLALLGALGLCLAVRMARRQPVASVGITLLCLGLAIGLASWFGLGRIETRLTTLSNTSALDDRLPLWASAMSIVRDFPVWGTGAGVYPYIVPLYQTTATYGDFDFDHVHNDYLEVLVEGGIVGLILCLFAIGLIYRLGFRAAESGSRATQELAFGGLFALTAVMIHSVGDFGLHIPAIMLLTTVCCAQLCGLGDNVALSLTAPTVQGQNAPEQADCIRLRGPAPFLGAAVCLGLALIIVSAGWRANVAESLRLAAFRIGPTSGHPGQEEKIALLESASTVAPGDATLCAELGGAYLDKYRSCREMLHRHKQLCSATETVLMGLSLGARGGALNPAPATIPCGLVSSALCRDLGLREEREANRTTLLLALGCFLQGRDRCPLLPAPNLALAAYAKELAQADTREAYKNRAQMLGPANPTRWYLCGLQELLDGQQEQAWRSWHRSLELSDHHLTLILDRCGPLLGPNELVKNVLPDKPELLVAAAERLYPGPGMVAERQPLLRKALALLDGRAQPLSAADLHTKALVYRLLMQPDEAVAVYRAQLAQTPREHAWRLELVRLLQEEGRLREAIDEVQILLALDPRNSQARQLLTSLSQALIRQQSAP